MPEVAFFTVQSGSPEHLLEAGMIKRWSIENFKSFRKATDLRLAPVTVFCGANSSGKSSIIQSILLLKQTVQYAPPTRSMALNGPLVKLGTFGDIKNASSQAEEVRIECDFTFEHSERLFQPSGVVGSAYYPFPVFGRSSIESAQCSFEWGTASAGSASSAPSFDAALSVPVLSRARVVTQTNSDGKVATRTLAICRRADAMAEQATDGPTAMFAVQEIDPQSNAEMLESKPGGRIAGAGARHFFPGRIAVAYDQARELAYIGSQMLTDVRNFRYYGGASTNVSVSSEIVSYFREYYLMHSPHYAHQNISKLYEGNFTLEGLADVNRRASYHIGTGVQSGGARKRSLVEAIPAEDIEQLLFSDFSKRDGVDRSAIGSNIPRFSFEASEYISAYFVAGVRYLGPLRDEPKPVYPLEALANPTEVGYRGEHTAAVLELHKDRQVNYVPSRYVSDMSNAQTVRSSLHDAVVDWLSYMGVASDVATNDVGKIGHQLQVRSPGINKFHDLTNVGVGVSQVLPIVVMALLADPPTMLIFEQPELHLHPSVQSRLADFFLSVSLTGKQCLLETHSEYLIERLRLRIAQSPADSIRKLISIYFTEREGDDTVCRPIEVSDYGAIMKWPRDFFDQSQIETEKILAAAQAKRKAERQQRDGSS